ncbi:MAG: DUF4810 domain-containing protein [Bacteroidetes bacterium]|nr:DUF4810 domain-containing protein [Bacteroidota bacterium]
MKNKTINLLLILLIVGCAPQTMYYWGNYSNTLYKYKKDATPEMLDKHKTELLDIISKSNEKGLRIPPGINAELGYIFLLQEQNDQAMVYLNKEKSTYPESTKFIDDLLNNLNEGEQNEN